MLLAIGATVKLVGAPNQWRDLASVARYCIFLQFNNVAFGGPEEGMPDEMAFWNLKNLLCRCEKQNQQRSIRDVNGLVCLLFSCQRTNDMEIQYIKAASKIIHLKNVVSVGHT